MLLDLLPQLLFLLCFTPVALLWGGCCCQPSCTFFTDNFTRADSDDPGDYTEVSGDWDIVSNTLRTTADNGVLIADTGNPDSLPNTTVTASVSIGTSGDAARIILDYTDSNNYWFVEVKAGSGAYVKIYERSGGSNTERATTGFGYTLSTGTHTVCACIIAGTKIAATVGTHTTLQFDSTFSESSWGLGTGTTSGTIIFNSVTASRVDLPNCPRCATGICNACTDGIPLEAAYVISGMANGTCTSCSGFDGTYIIKLSPGNGTPHDAFDGSCAWGDALLPNLCGHPTIAILSARFPFTSAGFIGAQHGVSMLTGLAQASVFGTNDTECMNLESKNIPFSENTLPAHCDASSATCEATTI